MEKHFTWAYSNKVERNGFKLKKCRFRLVTRKKFFCEGSEALEQVGCFIPGSWPGRMEL